MKWPMHPMADVCSIRTGKLDSNAAVVDGRYPFFTCAPDTLRIDTFAFDTEAVLLAGNNASGIYPLKYYEGRFNAYQRTYVLEPLDSAVLNARFLYYSLQPVLREFQTVSIGAATQYLTKAILDKFPLPVPPLLTQQSVVRVLSHYDDLMENNRRRVTLLEQAARLLYEEWFVRLRFPGYDVTRMFKGVPRGWRRAPLEEALVLQRGFDLPLQDRELGSIPVYGSTGIVGYHSKAKVVGPGIVTGRSGTLGDVHYVREDFWPLNTALWVKEFRCVTPLFAFFLLKAMDLRQYNGGVSVPTLDRNAVHRVEVVIPDPTPMRSFDKMLQPIFNQIGLLTLQNAKLKEARDLLLPRLMAGEVAV